MTIINAELHIDVLKALARTTAALICHCGDQHLLDNAKREWRRYNAFSNRYRRSGHVRPVRRWTKVEAFADMRVKKAIAKSYARLVSSSNRSDLYEQAERARREYDTARVRYYRLSKKNDEKYEAYMRRQRNVARRKLTRGRVEK